jgi:hypothetical protein
MILHGGLSGPSSMVLKPMRCGYSPLSTGAQQFFSLALFGCEPEAIGRQSPTATGSCVDLEKICGGRQCGSSSARWRSASSLERWSGGKCWWWRCTSRRWRHDQRAGVEWSTNWWSYMTWRWSKPTFPLAVDALASSGMRITFLAAQRLVVSRRSEGVETAWHCDSAADEEMTKHSSCSMNWIQREPRTECWWRIGWRII